MDVQAYISSGILELYVSGHLEPEEIQVVERMMMTYPEVRAEIDAIEAAIGQFAGETYEAQPSDGLLDRIMGAIEAEEEHDAPSAVITSLPVEENVRPEGKTRSLNWRWIAVAAAVALLISLAFNFYRLNALQDANEQLAVLNQQQQTLTEHIDRTSTQLELLASAESRIIDLKGLELAPDSRARVFWNPQTASVLFVMEGLPPLTEAQQYQLWAIIDGQAVDAGVLLADGSVELAKPVSGQVAAFAVTIEPKGGSVNPTLDQMVLLGEA